MYHRHEIPKRRAALTAAAVLCASQGIDYLTQQPQHAVAAASWGGILAPIYGLTWLAAGFVCLAHLRSGRLLWPMSVVAGICVAWGSVWLLGGLDTPTVRDLKAAAVYASIGVLVIALTGLTPLTSQERAKEDD